MKKFLFSIIIIVSLSSIKALAQTNIFPAAGNVGIGTTNPTSPLHLMGNLTLQGLSTSNYIPTIYFKRYSDGAPMFSLGYKNPSAPNSYIDFNSLNGNPITFSMVNVERMSILENGNVGVGTTFPQTKLDVRGSIISANPDYSNGVAGSVLQIQQGTTTGNTYSEIGAYINGGASWGNLILNRGGNVGIGITTPTQKLEIGGGRPMTFNSSLGAIKMKGDTGGWAMNYGFSGSSGTDLGGFWGYGGADAINQWSIGKEYTDNFFVVKNTGNVGVGTVNPIAKLEVAGGTVKFSENWFPYIDGNNYHRASNHIFADTGANEKMRITGTGNIGIGTTNPTEKLSVYGTNNSIPGIISLETSREDAQNREVGVLKAKNSGVEIARVGLNRAGGSYTGFLNFWVKKTNETALYEAMRISENGNVGIGTTAPVSKLHVVGDTRFDGNIYVGGSGDGKSFLSFFAGRDVNNPYFGGFDYDNNSGWTAWKGFHNYIQINDNGYFDVRKATNSVATTTNIFRIVANTGNIGIGTELPTQKLDVNGTALLRNGNSSGEFLKDQLIFGWNNTPSYQHSIKTRHHSGVASGNAIDFYTWKQGIDEGGKVGTQHVMTMDGQGFVGIGTTTPESKLHLKGDGNPSLKVEATNTSNIILKDPATTAQINTYNDGTLRLTSAINSASTQLVLGKDGGVGIGTSTPKNSLEIVATNKSGLTLTGLSQIVTQGGIVPPSRTLGINFSGEVVVLNGSNGTQPDFTENIKFINDISAGKTAKLISGNANGGAIRFGANAYKIENRDLDLGQTDNNGVFYPRMTVKTETGNIGIGTTVPSEKMTLESGNLQLQKGNGGAGSFGKIQWQNSLAYSNSARAFIEGRRGGNDDGNIDFATANTTGEVATVRMTINNSGNVGIGTLTPAAKLEIASENSSGIRLSGNKSRLTFAGSKTNLWNLDNANGSLRFFKEDYNANSFGPNGIVSMSISNNGNVGIGSDNPTRKFEVISPTKEIAYFRDNSTASEVVFRGNETQTVFDFGNRPLQVQFNSVPSFTLNTSGNMGIGITNPLQKLHVNGNSMLSGINPTQMYDWNGIAAFSTGIFGNTTNNTRFSIYTNSAGEAFSVNYLNGNVGVGTTTVPANYKFAVAGDMIAERVVVKLTGNWPDYVFSPNYKRSTLSEVEEFINKNHHLPNIPSAKEVADNGIDVGKMNEKLLEKMEEMTLYMIEQQKEIKALKDEVKLIKDKK